MIKTLCLVALTFVLLLPAALSELDTSPYTALTSQISEKQELLENARDIGDLETVISLNRAIANLTEQMSSPRMQTLKAYSQLRMPLEESDYLLTQMDATMPTTAAEAREDASDLKDRVSQAEQLYQSGDYSSALSTLNGVRNSVYDLPASLVSKCTTGLTEVKTGISRTSSITPSVTAMLETAGDYFADAGASYREAAQKLKEGDDAKAGPLFATGRDSASEAFSIISRSKSQGGDILGPFKLFLIIIPVIIVVVLLAYFYLQFNKQPVCLKCSVSKTSVKAGEEAQVERKILIRNPEASAIFAKVLDSPPFEASASGFTTEPVTQVGSQLFWEIGIQPGSKAEFSYKLKLPKMEAGKSLEIPPATVSYETEGTQKKFLGNAVTIRAS